MPTPESSIDDLRNRLIDLESILVHQQRSFEQLNDVVVDQSKRIMRLERSLIQLENQWKEMVLRSREPRDPLDEKPPHY